MADLQARLQAAVGDAYRIEKELGGGGMSRLFLATEASLHRQVVIKLLPPEFASEVSATRFRQEIEVAAHLQHTNILPVLTAGAKDDLLYYVMPFVSGESLRHRLTREGKLPVTDAVRILHEIADALAHAHAEGVIHRDIKPENILLLGSHAVLTDFGVARALAESRSGGRLTDTGLALGTPGYMSPEQAAGERNVDARADVYALAVVGYEMLAGFPPFAGPTAQAVIAAHLTATPKPLTDVRPESPPSVANAIARALAKDPNARLRTAAEFRDMIAAAATGAAGQQGNPLRVAGLYVLGAVAALGVAYFLTIELGLPSWVVSGAAVLLLVGLPIMIVTGLVERQRAIARTTGAERAAARGLQSWLTWRKAMLGGVAAFAGLGFVTTVYMAMRLLGIGPVGTLAASGVLTARDRLVLADFENRTPDTTLGRSVGEAFRVDLAQSPVVRLLDAAAIGDALRRMSREPGAALDLALAREIARREGAKAVVLGKIDPVGRGFVLLAELVAAADGAELVAVRETARDDGAIIDAVDRLSKKLRERIGESLKTIRASEPLERVTTSSLEALRKYSQAIHVNDAGESDRAVSLLDEAIALDSGFAMAHRKVAVILGNTFASRSRMIAAATQAFQHRDRLPPLERDLTIALYYSDVEFDRARVESAYRSALDVAPDDDVALNNLALLYNETRRFAAAESLALRGLSMSHPTSPLYTNAATAQVGQGKLVEAKRTIDLFQQQAPGHPDVQHLRARLAEANGAYDTAEAYTRALGRLQGDLSSQAGVAFDLFAQAHLRGRLAAAEREIRRYMDLSEQRHLPGRYVWGATWLGLLQVRYHTASGGRQAVEGALQRHPLATIAVDDRPYAALAGFFAEAGQPARARRFLVEYEAAIPEAVRRGNPFRHNAAASAALAEGRLQDAITGYRAWYDEGSWCTNCGLYELGRVYERAGQPDSARTLYERAITTPGLYRVFEDQAWLGPTYKRLGELYEERGDRAKALEYYGRFVDLWKDADPELQPIVADARAALKRLSGEPR